MVLGHGQKDVGVDSGGQEQISKGMKYFGLLVIVAFLTIGLFGLLAFLPVAFLVFGLFKNWPNVVGLLT